MQDNVNAIKATASRLGQELTNLAVQSFAIAAECDRITAMMQAQPEPSDEHERQTPEG